MTENVYIQMKNYSAALKVFFPFYYWALKKKKWKKKEYYNFTGLMTAKTVFKLLQ